MNIDPKHIDHDLLALYLLDEISSEGREAVESWINASGDNRALLDSLQRTWIESGKIEPAPVAVDVDLAWEKMAFRMKEEIVEAPVSSRKEGRSFSRSKFIYFTVAALLILSVVSLVFTDWFKKTVEPIPDIFESYAEVIYDTLSDGSSIALNENSKLVFAESLDKKERQVELVGEAFFAVAADATKPFVINAGIGAIKVLGTQFNVKAYGNTDLEVLVESGLVELSLSDSLGNPIETILLEAGEKGIVSYENRRIYKSEEQTPDEVYWANRKLIFKETDLDKVFEILKEYYSFEVEVEHEEILNCLLSASFTNQELPHIMEVIAVSFELELSQEDSTYQFKGKGCLDE